MLAALFVRGSPVFGIVAGEISLPIFLGACVSLGWLATRLTRLPVALFIGPVAALLAIAVSLLVKWLASPTTPLVGDGFAALALMHGGAGSVGAVAGAVRAPKEAPPWFHSALAILTVTFATVLCTMGVLNAVPIFGVGAG